MRSFRNIEAVVLSDSATVIKLAHLLGVIELAEVSFKVSATDVTYNPASPVVLLDNV